MLVNIRKAHYSPDAVTIQSCLLRNSALKSTPNGFLFARVAPRKDAASRNDLSPRLGSSGLRPPAAILALASCFVTNAALAEPAAWAALRARTRSVPIEQQAVTLTVRPSVRFASDAAAAHVAVRAIVSIGDLLAKAPAILSELARRKSSCEVAFSFSDVGRPALRADRLIAAGNLHAVLSLCKPLKVRVLEQSASFELAISPKAHADSVAPDIVIDRLDVTGAARTAPEAAAQLKDKLNGMLAEAVAGDSLALRFPEQLRPLGLHFVDARLQGSDAAPELSLEAAGDLTPKNFPLIVDLLLGP